MGCWKCGECGTSVQGRKRANNLVNCNVIKETKTFRSNSAKEWYKIRQHINCSSKNVIYLGTCLKCGIQAVGKATHFGKKTSNYITHIGKKGISVARINTFMKHPARINTFMKHPVTLLYNGNSSFREPSYGSRRA